MVNTIKIVNADVSTPKNPWLEDAVNSLDSIDFINAFFREYEDNLVSSDSASIGANKSVSDAVSQLDAISNGIGKVVSETVNATDVVDEISVIKGLSTYVFITDEFVVALNNLLNYNGATVFASELVEITFEKNLDQPAFVTEESSIEVQKVLDDNSTISESSYSEVGKSFYDAQAISDSIDIKISDPFGSLLNYYELNVSTLN